METADGEHTYDVCPECREDTLREGFLEIDDSVQDDFNNPGGRVEDHCVNCGFTREEEVSPIDVASSEGFRLCHICGERSSFGYAHICPDYEGDRDEDEEDTRTGVDVM